MLFWIFSYLFKNYTAKSRGRVYDIILVKCVTFNNHVTAVRKYLWAKRMFHFVFPLILLIPENMKSTCQQLYYCTYHRPSALLKWGILIKFEEPGFLRKIPVVILLGAFTQKLKCHQCKNEESPCIHHSWKTLCSFQISTFHSYGASNSFDWLCYNALLKSCKVY